MSKRRDITWGQIFKGESPFLRILVEDEGKNPVDISSWNLAVVFSATEGGAPIYSVTGTVTNGPSRIGTTATSRASVTSGWT